MIKLLLSGQGRISRPKFWAGFALVILVSLLGRLSLQHMGNNMGFFLLAPFFWSLFFYMLYCVYGKRLHDMGRSKGPYFAMIVVEILVMIIVMLSFGGAEYFSEFSQYSRKDNIDPEIASALTQKYQDGIKESMHLIGPLFLAVPLLFTGWVGLSKGDAAENRYGTPPSD